MQKTLEAPTRTLLSPSDTLISVEIAGLHVLPRILSDAHVREIMRMREATCHHEEEGHGTTKSSFRARKPHRLPWVARLIEKQLPDIQIEGRRPYQVDDEMQVYRLLEGAGEVTQHVDEDFDGPDGSRALCSILIYLNDTFEGGETIFKGILPAPRAVVGGGFLFQHDIPHEGLVVLRGEKYVLKTDLFFR